MRTKADQPSHYKIWKHMRNRFVQREKCKSHVSQLHLLRLKFIQQFNNIVILLQMNQQCKLWTIYFK